MQGLCKTVITSGKIFGIRATGLQERRATKNIIEAAEKALRCLWIKKGEPWCSVPFTLITPARSPG